MIDSSAAEERIAQATIRVPRQAYPAAAPECEPCKCLCTCMSSVLLLSASDRRHHRTTTPARLPRLLSIYCRTIPRSLGGILLFLPLNTPANTPQPQDVCSCAAKEEDGISSRQNTSNSRGTWLRIRRTVSQTPYPHKTSTNLLPASEPQA